MAHPKEDLRTQRARERELVAERTRRQEQRNTIVVIVLFLLALAVIGGVLFWLTRPQPAPQGVGVQVPDEGRSHVADGTDITYKHYPPTSGNHYGAPAPWGTIGTADRPLREGTFVHNLEHGGVVILYNCPQGCPELVQQLQGFMRSAPSDPQFSEIKLVMTPYSRGMNHKIAMLAWGWIEEFDAFDRKGMLAFYQGHVGQGPENVR